MYGFGCVVFCYLKVCDGCSCLSVTCCFVLYVVFCFSCFNVLGFVFYTCLSVLFANCCLLCVVFVFNCSYSLLGVWLSDAACLSHVVVFVHCAVLLVVEEIVLCGFVCCVCVVRLFVFAWGRVVLLYVWCLFCICRKYMYD